MPAVTLVVPSMVTWPGLPARCSAACPCISTPAKAASCFSAGSSSMAVAARVSASIMPVSAASGCVTLKATGRRGAARLASAVSCTGAASNNPGAASSARPATVARSWTRPGPGAVALAVSSRRLAPGACRAVSRNWAVPPGPVQGPRTAASNAAPSHATPATAMAGDAACSCTSSASVSRSTVPPACSASGPAVASSASTAAPAGPASVARAAMGAPGDRPASVPSSPPAGSSIDKADESVLPDDSVSAYRPGASCRTSVTAPSPVVSAGSSTRPVAAKRAPVPSKAGPRSSVATSRAPIVTRTGRVAWPGAMGVAGPGALAGRRDTAMRRAVRLWRLTWRRSRRNGDQSTARSSATSHGPAASATVSRATRSCSGKRPDRPSIRAGVKRVTAASSARRPGPLLRNSASAITSNSSPPAMMPPMRRARRIRTPVQCRCRTRTNRCPVWR